MKDGIISDNTSKLGGGGVFVGGGYNGNAKSLFSMEGGLISKNNGGEMGGGIVVCTGHFVMKDGEISENKSAGSGGGVYIEYMAIAELLGGKIINNTSKNGGSGVNVTDSTYEQDDAIEISGNKGGPQVSKG